MHLFKTHKPEWRAPFGAGSLIAAAVLVLLTQHPLQAGGDYQEAGATTVPPGVDDVSVVCAVGNVDNGGHRSAQGHALHFAVAGKRAGILARCMRR